MANQNERGVRKLRKGVVVSKMGAKSVVVEVKRRELHPLYGKVIVRSKKYHAHDEEDTAKVPNFIGKTLAESVLLLEKEGFNFQISGVDPNNPISKDAKVISQSLPPGSSVPRGSSILLYLRHENDTD
jgi:small subunit ribosomal protein S17